MGEKDQNSMTLGVKILNLWKLGQRSSFAKKVGQKNQGRFWKRSSKMPRISELVHLVRPPH